MRGWGQMLPQFLHPNVQILNEALGGMSTLSFPSERWERILKARPAFLIIQFGHNDQKQEDPNRYAPPEGSYRDHLRRYIGEALSLGIRPILVTPVRRRTFADDGCKLHDTLEPYADATKAVAAETDVPVIDLHLSSRKLFERLGKEGSDGLTVNTLEKPDAPNPDLTHFTELGATEIARLVVLDFAKVSQELANLVKHPLPDSLLAPAPAGATS